LEFRKRNAAGGVYDCWAITIALQKAVSDHNIIRGKTPSSAGPVGRDRYESTSLRFVRKSMNMPEWTLNQ